VPRVLPVVLLLTGCAVPEPGVGNSTGTSTGSATENVGSSTGTSGPVVPTGSDTGTTDPTSTSTGATPTTGVDTSTGDVSTGDATTGDATTGDAPVGPGYADVRQKSAHNSFQRDEALLDQLTYHRVRSLELDIHHSASLAPDIPGDWYVYHIDVVDDDSQCRRLSQCLAQVASLATAVPEHEVITLWLDLKDGFIADHQPGDLDAQLTAAFAGRLFTPGELLAACPGATTLRDAVTLPGCGWPALAQLRGRVVVALTGGGLEPGSKLAGYLGAEPAARAAFVAPDLAAAPALAGVTDAVFHNLAIADVAVAVAVREAGMVSRVWVADDAETWAAAEQAGVHHIASNKVNAAIDAWASTAGPQGWPFTCIDACDEPASEPGAALTISVDSGDLWGTSDDALLASFEPAGDIALTALLAVPSSHCEPYAKACLIAREDVAADAAYLAICRPADNHPLRVQLRTSKGGDSEAFELDGIAGLGGELPAFARLERAGACVRGLGSRDGVQWTLLAEHCFAAPPARLGVVASAHGAGEIDLRFIGLVAEPGGPIDAAMLTVTPLGAASGTLVDGL
jgi:hypothetical protein